MAERRGKPGGLGFILTRLERRRADLGRAAVGAIPSGLSSNRSLALGLGDG